MFECRCHVLLHCVLTVLMPKLSYMYLIPTRRSCRDIAVARCPHSEAKPMQCQTKRFRLKTTRSRKTQITQTEAKPSGFVGKCNASAKGTDGQTKQHQPKPNPNQADATENANNGFQKKHTRPNQGETNRIRWKTQWFHRTHTRLNQGHANAKPSGFRGKGNDFTEPTHGLTKPNQGTKRMQWKMRTHGQTKPNQAKAQPS